MFHFPAAVRVLGQKENQMPMSEPQLGLCAYVR